jgi:hypothetical protein
MGHPVSVAGVEKQVLRVAQNDKVVGFRLLAA